MPLRSNAHDAPETARAFQISASDVPTLAHMNLAPHNLWQEINPWFKDWTGNQVGLINISFGETQHPELEREILDEVGSYGHQLGQIGDAMEVLMSRVDRDTLDARERDTLTVLEGQLAKIRQVKRGYYAGEKD